MASKMNDIRQAYINHVNENGDVPFEVNSKNKDNNDVDDSSIDINIHAAENIDTDINQDVEEEIDKKDQEDFIQEDTNAVLFAEERESGREDEEDLEKNYNEGSSESRSYKDDVRDDEAKRDNFNESYNEDLGIDADANKNADINESKSVSESGMRSSDDRNINSEDVSESQSVDNVDVSEDKDTDRSIDNTEESQSVDASESIDNDRDESQEINISNELINLGVSDERDIDNEEDLDKSESQNVSDIDISEDREESQNLNNDIDNEEDLDRDGHQNIDYPKDIDESQNADMSDERDSFDRNIDDGKAPSDDFVANNSDDESRDHLNNFENGQQENVVDYQNVYGNEENRDIPSSSDKSDSQSFNNNDTSSDRDNTQSVEYNDEQFIDYGDTQSLNNDYSNDIPLYDSSDISYSDTPEQSIDDDMRLYNDHGETIDDDYSNIINEDFIEDQELSSESFTGYDDDEYFNPDVEQELDYSYDDVSQSVENVENISIDSVDGLNSENIDVIHNQNIYGREEDQENTVLYSEESETINGDYSGNIIDDDVIEDQEMNGDLIENSGLEFEDDSGYFYEEEDFQKDINDLKEDVDISDEIEMEETQNIESKGYERYQDIVEGRNEFKDVNTDNHNINNVDVERNDFQENLNISNQKYDDVRDIKADKYNEKLDKLSFAAENGNSKSVGYAASSFVNTSMIQERTVNLGELREDLKASGMSFKGVNKAMSAVKNDLNHKAKLGLVNKDKDSYSVVDKGEYIDSVVSSSKMMNKESRDAMASSAGKLVGAVRALDTKDVQRTGWKKDVAKSQIKNNVGKFADAYVKQYGGIDKKEFMKGLEKYAPISRKGLKAAEKAFDKHMDKREKQGLVTKDGGNYVRSGSSWEYDKGVKQKSEIGKAYSQGKNGINAGLRALNIRQTTGVKALTAVAAAGYAAVKVATVNPVVKGVDKTLLATENGLKAAATGVVSGIKSLGKEDKEPKGPNKNNTGVVNNKNTQAAKEPENKNVDDSKKVAGVEEVYYKQNVNNREGKEESKEDLKDKEIKNESVNKEVSKEVEDLKNTLAEAGIELKIVDKSKDDVQEQNIINDKEDIKEDSKEIEEIQNTDESKDLQDKDESKDVNDDKNVNDLEDAHYNNIEEVQDVEENKNIDDEKDMDTSSNRNKEADLEKDKSASENISRDSNVKNDKDESKDIDISDDKNIDEEDINKDESKGIDDVDQNNRDSNEMNDKDVNDEKDLGRDESQDITNDQDELKDVGISDDKNIDDEKDMDTSSNRNNEEYLERDVNDRDKEKDLNRDESEDLDRGAFEDKDISDEKDIDESKGADDVNQNKVQQDDVAVKNNRDYNEIDNKEEVQGVEDKDINVEEDREESQSKDSKGETLDEVKEEDESKDIDISDDKNINEENVEKDESKVVDDEKSEDRNNEEKTTADEKSEKLDDERGESVENERSQNIEKTTADEKSEKLDDERGESIDQGKSHNQNQQQNENEKANDKAKDLNNEQEQEESRSR